MKFSNKIRMGLATLVTFTLIGCGGVIYTGYGSKIKSTPEANTVFIYGYFNTDEAPFKFQAASLTQVRPVTKKDYIKMHVDKQQGVFYVENMPVGSYKFNGIEGNEKNPISQDYWSWAVNKEDRNHRIEKSGFYFLGSYNIRIVDRGGFMSPRKYVTDRNKAGSPSEKEVLQMILLDVKGTKWEALIQKRIKELS